MAGIPATIQLSGTSLVTTEPAAIITFLPIFIFGNKIEDGEIVLSNGMREELEIAKEKNLLLIPNGSTGYISELFWNELKEENSESKIYEELGDENKEPKEIIDLILDFLRSKS